MSIKDLEEEILEIEKVKEHFKSGSIEWNNIDAIISDKKRRLSRLKMQDEGEEADLLGGCGGDGEENVIPGRCGGDCGSCGGGR